MKAIDWLAISAGTCILMTTLASGCSSGFTPGIGSEAVIEGLLPLELARPQDQIRQPGVAAAVSGGTLLVTRNGAWAVVSDPDAAKITVVDLANKTLAQTYSFSGGATPGRAAEAASGDVFLVMRGRDSVVKLVPGSTRPPVEQRVCAEPRGVAVQTIAGQEFVKVVCAGGQLVTLAADDLRPLGVKQLGVDDLRGVTTVGNELWIHTFRQTAVLRVLADGTVDPARIVPAPYQDSQHNPYTPHVTYGMIALPGAGGGVALLHQEHTLLPMLPSYNCMPPRCPTPILPFLTLISAAGKVASFPLAKVALAVDAAVTPDGQSLAVLSAAKGSRAALWWGKMPKGDGASMEALTPGSLPTGGDPIAISAQGTSGFVVQTKNPSAVQLFSPAGVFVRTIALNDTTMADPGADLFHTANASGLSCAGCHPEAESDGALWKLPSNPETIRHPTQSLAGLVSGSSRFHWTNDQTGLGSVLLADLQSLGLTAPRSSVDAMAQWLAALPARWNPPILPAEQKQAARGQAVFAAHNCVSCHAGPYSTQADSAQVGSGANPYKVPSLRYLSARDPYFHDGCAATLRKALDGTCATSSSGGGGVHNLSALPEQDLSDLIFYLRSL